MKRKILSLILVFAMTVSLLTVGTGAVEPTYGDTAGHWAESSIERWSAYGIIQGSNGQFDPNGQLTCAQLATILAKLLKLPAAKDAGFTDNTADAWYYDAINRCAAAGILNGNGDGTVTPEAPITRERAMVMLARALGIEPLRKPDLTKYTDAAQVSAYAQGYVAALIEAGIVGGVTADELAPQDNINRASTVTILDRAISTYADKAGATVKADGKGLVLVVAENVKITGAPEGTKIVVADGATGLTVNSKSVSDDQTYIVPKTEPAKPSSGSSSGGSYTPPHSHSYDTSKWVFDDTKHWHASTCGHNLKIDEAEHTYNDSNVCTVCGQVNPTVTVAKIGDKNYATLADAMTYAVNNDTIVLVKPETITSAVLAENKSVALDLNGQTLTANVESNKAAIQVDGSNAALTIKDSSGSGKISSTGYGVYALNGASVTVESGSIESDVSPLSGNNTTGNMNFTVKGGTLTAQKGPAIYMPGQVNLVITGGTLNGGISLRMGQVNIGGGTINAVTSNIDAPSSFYNYSGNAWLPDALYVFGGTYTSDDATYGNSLNLNITGGAFNCTNGQGSAVAIYDLGKVAQTMDVKISGDAALTTNATGRGAYQVLSLSDISVTSPAEGYGNPEHTGKVSSAITGGTFSSNPSEYVAEGYFSLPNENSTYTVVTADQITSGVTIQGIAGYEHRAFATAANAFEVVKSDLEARCGLVEQAMNEAQFNAFFIENGKITWTVYGEQDVTDSRTFSFGRKANRFGEGRHITEINIIGGNDTAALNLSAVNGTFALPYNWWNVEDSANTALKCKNIKFNGIMSMPSGIYQCTLHPTTYEFDGCTFNGNLYSYQDFDVEMSIRNCTFNAPENTQYAFMSQGKGGTITLDGNTFNGYTRGVNLQRATANFVFTNNTITSTVSEPDRAAIQLTDGKSFVVNGNTVRVNAGNAFWFHDAATNSDVTYTISDNNIKAAYIGYSGTSFNVNEKITTSSGNKFNNTDTTKCMKKGATVAEATNLTAIH